MKKILKLFILAILCVLTTGCLFERKEKPLIVKEILSEEELLYNVETIFMKQSTKIRRMEVSVLIDKYGYQNNQSNFSDYKYQYKELGEDEIALQFTNYSNIVGSKEPFEIEACFAVWCYLDTIHFDKVVDAIVCRYLNGMDSSMWCIAVKKDEYENIKKEVDITGLDGKEVAKRYAEKWIEKVGYVKK